MLRNLRQILAPPTFENEEKNRVATLLNSIIWAVILIGSIYTVSAPFILGQYFSAVLTGVVVLAGIIALQLMKRGMVQWSSIILLIVFDFILILSIVISDGTLGASYFSLILTTVIAGTLLVFVPCLGAYVTPELLGGGKSLMIGNLIQNQFGAARNWPFGSALAFVLLGIVLLAMMLYLMRFRRTPEETT